MANRTEESEQRKDEPPCRLAVLLAREAPRAVILRRGPTKWVQLITWDTRHDQFEAGQWFNGRIYDRRCDLSPDGTLLIYFANKISRQSLRDREYTYAWTAISKPPYFTALALWPKGDCWHGGGLFAAGELVWLNHRPEVARAHPRHQPPAWMSVVPNPEACGEDSPIWDRRMRRDGWMQLQQGHYPVQYGKWQTEQVEIWEKACPQRAIRLRRQLDAIDFKHLGGPYLESFMLIGESVGELPIPNVQWADWDQAGRMVFARDGRLFVGTIDDRTLVEHELANFNDYRPEAVETPEHAARW